jgi:hypothetical protein
VSTSPPANLSQPVDSGAARDTQAIDMTRRWIERVVIGLNLCPFARAPFVHERVRLCVSTARDTDALLDDLRHELGVLHATDPQTCETTLLIHPHVLGDFLDYNDFLDEADGAVESLGLQSELQIASFHPDYRFADADADAIENHTNRSPFPTLHLLRESSIAHAVATMRDTGDIYRRNMRTLRELGVGGLRAALRGADDA